MQKNPCLNQATQKILAKIFLPQKISKRKFQTQEKPLYHPCHLKSGVSWPLSPVFCFAFWFELSGGLKNRG